MQMQLGQLPELRQQPDVTDLRDTVGGDVKALQVFQCLGSVHATQVVAGDVPTSGEKARPGGGEEGVRGPRIVMEPGSAGITIICVGVLCVVGRETRAKGGRGGDRG